MKQFVVVFLMFASLSAYSKQVEKASLKQIKKLIPEQAVVYVCKIEASTGYAYQDGKWQVTQFETGEKFLLREFIKDDPGFIKKDQTPYGVFDIGEKNPQMYCNADEEGTRVSCSGIGTLEFSTKTGQFFRAESFGSVSPDVIYNTGPKMMYGSCVLKREVNL